MIKNTDWTRAHCGVTHKIFNGIQYSITDYENFAELMIYSRIANKLLGRKYFLIGEDNMLTVEDAILSAKTYVEKMIIDLN